MRPAHGAIGCDNPVFDNQALSHPNPAVPEWAKKLPKSDKSDFGWEK